MGQLKPPAPPYKVVVFYTVGSRFGFSEVYWVNQDSLSDAAGWVETNLLPQRLAICNQDVTCLAIRASDASQPRHVAVLVPPAASSKGSFNGASGISVHPDLSILIKQFAADFSYSYRYMSGIPSEVYVPPDQLGTPAGWALNLSNFQAALLHTMMVSKPISGGSSPVVKSMTNTEVHGIRERKRGRSFQLPHGIREVR